MTSPEFTRNRDNYCYRHPDRQSFVLCQRCLRTVCPECQTQGAVGVICPECLAQQRQSRTPAQRKAARRWGSSRGSRVATASGRTPVTYAIIGITVLGFVLQLLLPNALLQQWLAFTPALLYPDVSGYFEPWRLVTLLFLHSGWLHIALNMLALFMLGRSLEPLLGATRFLALYLIAGLGGSVAVTLISFDSVVVGASGAIYGLFGALLVIGRHLGANITGIAVILAVNFAIGFLPGFNISWEAHLGGLVAGVAVGLIYARTRQQRQRTAQILLLLGLVAVLLVLLLIPAFR